MAEAGNQAFIDFLKRSEEPNSVELQDSYDDVFAQLGEPGYFVFSSRMPLLAAASKKTYAKMCIIKKCICKKYVFPPNLQKFRRLLANRQHRTTVLRGSHSAQEFAIDHHAQPRFDFLQHKLLTCLLGLQTLRQTGTISVIFQKWSSQLPPEESPETQVL